jgi:hypothetical protein
MVETMVKVGSRGYKSRRNETLSLKKGERMADYVLSANITADADKFNAVRSAISDEDSAG